MSIVIIAFVGLWYEDDYVKAYILQGSKKEMANYGHPEREGFTAAWDRIQIDVSRVMNIGTLRANLRAVCASFIQSTKKKKFILETFSFKTKINISLYENNFLINPF